MMTSNGRFRSRKIPVLLAAAALASSSATAASPGPVVNEILVAGGGNLLDEDGDSSDWIEILNAGDARVDLGGWYLTDDGDDLMKWRLPAAPLDPGGFLVVFASGKGRAVAGMPIHTNFRLDGDGEFLALVAPDGTTIVHACSPAYPRQYDGISYGLAGADDSIPIVAPGAAVRYRVPAGAGETGWQDPAFDDGAWAAGTTALGYGTGEGMPAGGDPVDLAAGGTATQSSEYGAGVFPAGLAIDGDPSTFTHTGAGLNLPATWEIDLGEVCSIASVVLHNRADCCPSRLRDITVTILDAAGGTERFKSALLNAENVLGGGGTGGPDLIALDLVSLTGGLVEGRIVRVVRTPDPDLSGTGGEGNPDEEDVLSLGEVEVTGVRATGYGILIGTDVEAAMKGVRSSLCIRIPFAAPDPLPESLSLKLRYEDGFVAWLNGVEVARRNAPDPLRWDSAATAERTGAEALAPETIDISANAGLLQPGANVLAIQALNVSAGDEGLLILPELAARRPAAGAWRFFRDPTPGAPNGEGSPGFVADTRFSRDRAFCDEPFDLEIATETAGAEIRYTLDGTVPDQASGLLYTEPIPIDRTTTVRARAFKPDLDPTNVDTQTYIFLEDVVAQSAAATLAAGFPSTWGGTAPDYGMDPDVIGPGDKYAGIYAATIRDDLASLPAMSIVMPIDDLFGTKGIYTNSQQGGINWERAASAELIHPDGRQGFQIDCGIRIQGGWFRQHSGTKKHSFRLLFKKDYGPAKLRYPLFGKRAVEEFDTITLRAGANDGYAWDAARYTEQYTRDEFGRSLQGATGNPGSHGTFVHLFIDGIYWGLYNPAERPDHAFSASYVGGEKEDWDSVHDSVTTNGNLTAWSAMLNQTAAARTSLTEFMKLQGLNPDGSRNPAFQDLLEVDEYIDYLLVNLWGGNWDWPWKNWWAGRSRLAGADGFRFYCWDFENTCGNNRDRSPLTKNALQNDFSSAGQVHANLRTNPEYRLRFADRAQRFLAGDGVLTPDSLIPRYEVLAAQVERAIVAESARWGDGHWHPPLTLKEWTTERNWILGTYLPQRTAIVLGQLETAGLYPAIEAPAFDRSAGRAPEPFILTAAAPAGQVYVTADGSDPRLPGGAVAPGASTIDEVILLDAGAPVRIHVPADDGLGSSWTASDFDDASWAAGTTGVGFDSGTGYESLIETDVQSIFLGQNSSIYLRIAFDVDPDLFAGGAPLALGLLMKYDDGYVAYLNGTRIAARLAPATLAWNSRASGSHPDAQAVAFERVSVPDALGLLAPGRNVLAIHGLNVSSTDGDFLIVPAMAAVPASEGIPITEATAVKARALVGTEWSPLAEAAFFIDTPLRISEVMYHPAPPPAGSPYEAGDFEFVEVLNIGQEPVDLNGVRIEGGIEFEFPGMGPASLPPGGVVVVAKRLEAFASRYETDGMALAGEYRNRLDNLGDVLILRAADGSPILDFEFDDRWYPETDGGGPSLIAVDPRQDPVLWESAEGWKPSGRPQGSPGIDETAPAPEGWQVPSDLNGDARLDLSDAIALLQHLFLGGWQVLPCGDGTLSTEANRLLLDASGENLVDLTDAVHVLSFLFMGGGPPVLGADCTKIAGCPDSCR